MSKMAKEKARKKDIMYFAGAWVNINEKDIESMKEEIYTLRKRTTKELLRST